MGARAAQTQSLTASTRCGAGELFTDGDFFCVPLLFPLGLLSSLSSMRDEERQAACPLPRSGVQGAAWSLTELSQRAAFHLQCLIAG